MRTLPRHRASAALAALACTLLAGTGTGAAQEPPTSAGAAPPPPRDELLEQRRTNLPNVLPWPAEFFQPKEAVRGAPRKVLRVAAPGRRSVSDAALAAALEYAKATKSTGFAVYHRGRVQTEWYAPGSGPDTITHTYNLQYGPLVLLIGIAIAEGRIRSADEPASTYLPEWRGTPKAGITIRQLLQQNAGLELRFDASRTDGMYSRDARAYWGSNSQDVIVREYPAIQAPGTVFDYNYIVPPLLGLILERATGRRYADYLSEKLWRPLGNHTAYLWLNRPGGESHQDTALFSGPRDWLHLGVLLLDEGRFAGRRLVPAAWIGEMRKPSAPNPNFGFTYLGSPFQGARRMATDPRVTYTVKSSEPFAADDVYYIDGYGGQRVYVVPSQQLVIVRVGEVSRDWDNSRLANLVIRGITLPAATRAP